MRRPLGVSKSSPSRNDRKPIRRSRNAGSWRNRISGRSRVIATICGWRRAIMKAVVFEKFADPAEVLQVREVPEPEPGPGQVRVRMLLSPIGPADFLTVRGEYGYRPKLPPTPGVEGVGIVEAGRGLLGRMRVWPCSMKQAGIGRRRSWYRHCVWCPSPNTSRTSRRRRSLSTLPLRSS
jgi:hypothetical protein